METKQYTWLLGAADPEMERIEALLLQCGQRVVHAQVDGRRCHPGNAYLATPPAVQIDAAVECAFQGMPADVMVFDHHHSHDRGYGVPPSRFLDGSSIGQVIAQLACFGALAQLDNDDLETSWDTIRSDGSPPGLIWADVYRPDCDECDDHIRWAVSIGGPVALCIPSDYVCAAAADHCPAEAYRGQCLGVDPTALANWRVKVRAAFQRRDPLEIQSDICRSTLALHRAPRIELAPGASVADMRPGRGTVCGEHGAECAGDGPQCWGDSPELPEAGLRSGIAWIGMGRPRAGERRKVVLQGATPEQLAAWPIWAAAQGLTDCYGGDPARGFAGGYQ